MVLVAPRPTTRVPETPRENRSDPKKVGSLGAMVSTVIAMDIYDTHAHEEARDGHTIEHA